MRGGGIDRILFEAPRKDQQAWLIRTFGPDVNLANIALRRGARARDTAVGAASATPATSRAHGSSRRDSQPEQPTGAMSCRVRIAWVAVTSFDGELDEGALARHFVGREAYRRTRFIVVRNGDETAIVAVQKESTNRCSHPIIGAAAPRRAGRVRVRRGLRRSTPPFPPHSLAPR